MAEWKSKGLHVTGSVCDVSCPKSRANLVAAASKLFDGKLDILVSNVGFNIRKPTVDFTPEEYRRLMDTNLEATFAVSATRERERLLFFFCFVLPKHYTHNYTSFTHDASLFLPPLSL